MKKLLLTLTVLVMAASGAKAQIANPGMETWHNYTVGIFPPTVLQAPDHWYGLDSLFVNYSLLIGGSTNQQVFKSTDAHSGTYAALVITRTQGFLGAFPGVLMNAQPSLDLEDSSVAFIGGTPISGPVDSVSAWVNYIHPGEFTEDDTAQMQAIAFKSGAGAGGTDSMVGYGSLMIPPTVGYEYRALSMNYFSTLMPDKLLIIFSSSPFNMSSGIEGAGLDSSRLYVDDVAMVMSPVHTQQLTAAGQQIAVYPNPAKDMLQVAAPGVAGALTLEIFNVSGKCLARQTFEQSTQLPTTALPAGSYFYRVHNAQGAQLKAGKLQIAR